MARGGAEGRRVSARGCLRCEDMGCRRCLPLAEQIAAVSGEQGLSADELELVRLRNQVAVLEGEVLRERQRADKFKAGLRCRWAPGVSCLSMAPDSPSSWCPTCRLAGEVA